METKNNEGNIFTLGIDCLKNLPSHFHNTMPYLFTKDKRYHVADLDWFINIVLLYTFLMISYIPCSNVLVEAGGAEADVDLLHLSVPRETCLQLQHEKEGATVKVSAAEEPAAAGEAQAKVAAAREVVAAARAVAGAARAGEEMCCTMSAAAEEEVAACAQTKARAAKEKVEARQFKQLYVKLKTDNLKKKKIGK